MLCFVVVALVVVICFVKQKTAYEMRISDWSSDVCSSDLGKTTSLAAVSDLLFGFPVRSPYNFLFDYSLLRVGAVLEDGGTTLACRRKKGTSGTLLGADDVPIDEAPLAAMLRGQTRDRSEQHTSELQSLMRISYAVFCLKKKTR